MQDITPRQLLKQLDAGAIAIVITDDGNDPTLTATGEGWISIPQVLGNTVGLVNRTYIDLAGYTQDDLTTFVQSAAIQEQGAPLFSTASTASIPMVWTYDFITTRRITNEELSQLSTIIPGYLPSTLDLQEMIYGQHRTYATNAQVPGTYITVNADTLGSGNPSAADRLHWTRVLYCLPTGTNTQFASVGVMPSNLVCQAVTGKEKDLVYIERLRRAYTQERSE